MSKCTFCGVDIKVGTGKMFIKKDGRIFYFCSHKCEKNLNMLGRKSLRVQWTGDYKRVKAAAKASGGKTGEKK